MENIIYLGRLVSVCKDCELMKYLLQNPDQDNEYNWNDCQICHGMN